MASASCAEPDEAVFIGWAFDDFRVHPLQRCHLQVVATARDGEAGACRCRNLMLGQSRVSFYFGGRARTAFSLTSMPQPGPFGKTNSPFSIVGTVR